MILNSTPDPQMERSTKTNPNIDSSGRRDSFWATFLFPSVRKIVEPDASSGIYLTFDDGPDPVGTSRVLDLLKKHSVHATFFLVAEKAQNQREIVSRILADGHAIGDHSLNHRYEVFFSGVESMLEWVQASEKIFQGLGISPVGFRPPAGARSPNLHRVLNRLGLAMILWNHRFFDTTIQFSTQRADRSLSKIKPGDIILLHDRQKPERIEKFLSALEYYIEAVKRKGLQFQKLTVSNCKATLSQK